MQYGTQLAHMTLESGAFNLFFTNNNIKNSNYIPLHPSPSCSSRYPISQSQWNDPISL